MSDSVETKRGEVFNGHQVDRRGRTVSGHLEEYAGNNRTRTASYKKVQRSEVSNVTPLRFMLFG